MICYTCKIEKENSEFYPSSITKQDYRCKPCQKERFKSDSIRRYKTNHTEERYRRGKNNAKSNGKPFTLSLDEYREIVEKPCFYCNEKKLENGTGLDRIDNDKSLGYKIGNVLPCCSDCNRIRGHLLTVEEAKIAITAVLDYRKSKLPR